MGTGWRSTSKRKKIARDYARALYMPGSISFYPDEISRIEDVELVLLGIPPSELSRMSPQLKFDVLEINKAKQNPKEYLMR